MSTFLSKPRQRQNVKFPPFCVYFHNNARNGARWHLIFEAVTRPPRSFIKFLILAGSHLVFSKGVHRPMILGQNLKSASFRVVRGPPKPFTKILIWAFFHLRIFTKGDNLQFTILCRIAFRAKTKIYPV